ncbi:MAG TPA: glycosyltransferase family 2 protein [Candidatus Saccharimonadia bacterium]|nr:glycosyltransferase family 2 protein [Candidatus Saccharimonadia bacterium]
MQKRPIVAVIVLNYHQDSVTQACLDSLQLLDDAKAEIHVVLVEIEGDAKQDATLLHRFPSLHILHSENLGFSGGNNLGAEYALNELHAEYVMLLNNDTRVEKGLVAELLLEAEEHQTAPALYCPKIYFEKGHEFHGSAYSAEEKGRVLWYAGGIVDMDNVYAWHRGVDEVDHGQFDVVQQTMFATGCCLFFSKETWQKVGELDVRYFLYSEDLDYSTRVLELGGEIWYVPLAQVWHQNAGSTAGSGSDTQVYYQTRNRLIYGMQYAEMRTKFALVKEAMKMWKQGKLAEKEAVQDFFMRRFGQRRA